jgi:hypothetical protein
MTAIKSDTGAEVSIKKVCGYEFQVMKMPSGWISFRAPMGENAEDKKMFDSLVYFNQGIYQGKNKETIAKKVKEFITKWKISNGTDKNSSAIFNKKVLSKTVFKLWSLSPDKYKLITIDKATDDYRAWVNQFGPEEEYKTFSEWLLTEI